MTKVESVNNILYDLKLKGSADFEADYESYNISELNNGGYVIESHSRYIEIQNLTQARKEINKLGTKLLWL